MSMEVATAEPLDLALAWRIQSLDAWAFGKGSDARLAGDSFAANPYPITGDTREKYYWSLGWLSVDQSWGCLVRGRWPVKPLPPVDRPFSPVRRLVAGELATRQDADASASHGSALVFNSPTVPGESG
jgi:hypothetical protein